MIKKNSAIEQELLDYIMFKNAQLESANQKLVYGDGVYPGTARLRDFYAGDQWDTNVKRGGGAKRTFNLLRRVIENNTAFLANEPPEVSVDSRDSSNELENLRAEQIAKILGDVHRTNNLPFQFMKLVKIANITGIFFLFGPIWDDDLKTVKYSVFENPENVRPIWRDSNFSDMVGFINRFRIEETVFKKLYEKQLKERGIISETIKGKTFFDNLASATANAGPFHDFKNLVYDYPMVEVQEYYDDQYYMLTVGTGDTAPVIVDFKEHKYGFIPGQYLPSIYDISSGRGTSDIEDLLGPQQAYNESKSNIEDIIAQTAYSQYWGKNLENFGHIHTPEGGTILNLPEDAEINAMPRTGTTFPLETYLSGIQEDIINIGGQNQALFPGGSKQVLAASGRALSVLMQPVNNNINLKKIIMTMAMENLNRNILHLLEKKEKGAKEIIDGNYNVKVFLSSVLTRDVTEEINKFNGKIQSLTTTQKNLGIPSPSEEQKLMKQELKDPILGVETARQPGLIQQAVMTEQQNIQQLQQQPGFSDVNGMQAMLNGSGETQPMTVPQQGMPSAASPQGNVRAGIQRNTGVNIAGGK